MSPRVVFLGKGLILNERKRVKDLNKRSSSTWQVERGSI